MWFVSPPPRPTANPLSASPGDHVGNGAVTRCVLRVVLSVQSGARCCSMSWLIYLISSNLAALGNEVQMGVHPREAGIRRMGD